ncbi:hypothetical protein ABH931_000076 [Streptacidiphilus sp. MAP12-33]|uniref:DUF4097 family beta strand repeat-containing protein n=1 Tax=Streptacidiphilus sp. MAP12-33 TaxID=3156266 RepID=UPI0035192218
MTPTIPQRFDTPAPITAVLDISAGHVEVIAADRADTTVEVRPVDATKGRDVKLGEQTTLAFSKGVLRIETAARIRSQILGPSGSVAVTLHVPTGSHIQVKAGAVGFRGVGTLGDVAVDGGYGANGAVAIEIDEAAGARLTAHAGDVTVGRLSGPARITTGMGDIRIDEAVTGTVELRTGVGDLTVGAAHGVSAALDAGTTYGRIHNALKNSDGTVQLTIHAMTAQGDITARSL